MFLSKRNNGYYYLIYKDKATGKKQVVSARTKSKREANIFLLNYSEQYKANQKKNLILISYTLKDLQTEINKYISLNLSPASIQIYNKVFCNLFNVFENKALETFNFQDFENYKSIRLQNVNETTVNIELRTLKAIFNFAIKIKYISENPLKNVKQFKIPQKERLSFNNEELDILMNCINEEGMKNIVLFGLYTGCRISEILNLQWKDINFQDKTILIKNKSDFQTKSRKNRFIPINENLYNVLLSLLNFKNNDNIIQFNNPDNYVFKNQWNYRYNRKSISKKFKYFLRKSNLDNRFHFHCLRHTFISMLIKQGVNINFVKEIAGHSAISTTMNYIHLDTNDLRNAVNKISYSC